jgi:predicted nucleic acid-binding protein
VIVGVAETHAALWYLEAMRQVPRAQVPDLPDRIVAATAAYLRVPVISRDGRI